MIDTETAKLLIKIILLMMFILILYFLIFHRYNNHKSMTKALEDKYGKANYKTFLKEFNKYNWKWDGNKFSNSLFDNASKSRIHASVIVFNSNGMIMKNVIDYWKMRLFLKKYFRNRKRAEEIQAKYNWE